jgi:hypothetical protein
MKDLFDGSKQINTTSQFNNINDLLNSKQLNEIPVKLFTEKNGSSTVISQTDKPYGEQETSRWYNYQDYFGFISIRQFDYNRVKTWETLLPIPQYFKSYKHFYPIKTLSCRWQEQEIFGDLPETVYERQFLSFNTYRKDRDFYIIFNDYNRNFTSTLEDFPDTVYGFSNTNACYYKITDKHQVSRHYLFGERIKNEFRCSFIEGAGYDEERGIYATLIQRNKGDDISLNMAWVYLK